MFSHRSIYSKLLDILDCSPSILTTKPHSPNWFSVDWDLGTKNENHQFNRH